MRNFVFKILIFVVISSFAFSLTVFADEPLATTHTLEALVAKWVDLRKELAQEKEKWNEEKSYLEQEKALLLKEKKMLDNEIAQASREQTQAEAERVELLQSKEISQKTLNEYLPALSRAEANLKKWKDVVPSSLSPALKKSFGRLQKASGKTISQRLQLILSIYGEIERLEHNVHICKERLKTDSGKLQEMDVIYLGLSQGFAVSLDNKIAGKGSPTKNGWRWEWRHGIAKDVRKAIAFYQRKEPADFVNLPLKIKEVSQ